ncbi:MAG: succinylglutamate desuccinylase/aspartoacylase family protein [Hahellaceae bacterium]|jgi:predicted deacylase|nr:succinylglutamate desuccinylase/aspartoacylase family protein [Hahellaceae bacterium]
MQVEVIPLMSPSPGTSRQLNVFRFGGSLPGPTIYLQAGLHADEWPGLLVLQHLLEQLEAIERRQELCGTVIVVPYANPVGMSQNLFGYVTGRFDMTGTGNFNRNYLDPYPEIKRLIEGKLTDNKIQNQHLIRAAFVEAVREWRVDDEVGFLKKTLLALSTEADVVLDLHCDDRTEAHLYGVKHQADECVALAACLGFSYVFLEDLEGIVAFDGAHLQFWHRLQLDYPEKPIGLPVFAVTLEYRGQIDVEDSLAQSDASRLLAYLRSLGVYKPDTNLETELVAGGLAPEAVRVSPLEAVDTVKASAAGLVVFSRALGSFVKAGERFAEIVQIDHPAPNRRIAVNAIADGYIVGLSHRRLVRPGDQIAKIAGATALPHRQLGNLLQL